MQYFSGITLLLAILLSWSYYFSLSYLLTSCCYSSGRPSKVGQYFSFMVLLSADLVSQSHYFSYAKYQYYYVSIIFIVSVCALFHCMSIIILLSASLVLYIKVIVSFMQRINLIVLIALIHNILFLQSNSTVLSCCSYQYRWFLFDIFLVVVIIVFKANYYSSYLIIAYTYIDLYYIATTDTDNPTTCKL